MQALGAASLLPGGRIETAEEAISYDSTKDPAWWESLNMTPPETVKHGSESSTP